MFWTAHSLNSLWRAFDVVWLAYAWPPKRGEFRFSESDRGEFYQVLPKKLVYGVFGVTFEPGWSLQIFTVETTSQISMSFGSRDLQEPPPEFGAENVETPCVSTVNVLAIEDSYGKWPSSRCVTVFYHVFNHVYHVLPCRIYVLSMAYPYFPMCFTMCLPIKSSFFWLSHVLPEGHLAPGPAHRWHWSFTRSAQSPAIFQGNTASSSCFFFFRVHVSICFLHSEKGISMDILSFFCHKIRRSEITMVFFQRSQVSTPFLGTCWIFHGLSKAGPLEEEARSIFRSELAFGYVKQFANWKMAIVDFPISMVDLSSSLCKRLPEGKYIRHRKCLVI